MIEAQIEQRSLASLTPNPSNTRVHSPEQIEIIRASMREFGWTIPMLIDEADVILAGNGRYAAALTEGMTQGPVIVARGWTEAQKRAYAIADNKIALLSTFDEAILRTELLGLRALGFDLGLTGFSALELEPFNLDGLEINDPEAVPELPTVPVTLIGDLWVCGDHQVLCGDATDADTVGRLLGKVKPSLMVTDPPYGVAYDPAWRNAAGVSTTKRTGKVLNDDRADWREAWALFPGDAAYVWHGGMHSGVVQASLVACGLEIRSQIIWAKDRFALSRGNYHWRHEPCWYAVRKGRTAHWSGGRNKDTVWRIVGLPEPLAGVALKVLQVQGAEDTIWEIPMSVDDGSTRHGTQKPVECMKRPMQHNSVRGDAVYDPFLGSGTSMIAAEMEKRRCFGLELDPAYVDVIVQRWQNFTGRIATLDGGGPFDEVKAKREQVTQ